MNYHLYAIGSELLSIDLDPLSLSDLVLLELVCVEMLESVKDEFEKRDVSNEEVSVK